MADVTAQLQRTKLHLAISNVLEEARIENGCFSLEDYERPWTM